MKKKITRREFVQTTAAATATVALVPTLSCSGSSPYDAKGLPTVKLGNTGVQVPLLGFGLGSRWMAVENDDKALEMLDYAFDQGLYYWDTAASYGNDRISSEERVGKILKDRREKVFLVTKTGDRGADNAKESIERSLKRLQTDYIDLMHVHSISSMEDAEQLGEKGKVLEVLHQYKSEGVIKHIGFTGHTTADGMKRAAELYDFEVMMIALNHHIDDGTENFEEMPAPYAKKKGLGVVAIKVIRPRETLEGLAGTDLIRYALTLEDFHMINVAMDSMEILKTNLEILREFKPLEESKMEEIRLALQPFYHGKHIAWMQPSYVDGWNGRLHLA
jgi:aryl-alcohol dehydrogenase-like predicted oxidoreductase